MKLDNLIKIVQALSTNIFEGYNINQVSRLSKVSLATTFRVLKSMEENKEVLKSRKGNNLFYKLNLKNITTVKYCSLASVKKRESFYKKHPQLVPILLKLKKLAEVVILFGSLAREERKPRDIDILFLSDKLKVKSMERNLERKISPLYMNIMEFKSKIKERDKVCLNIITEGIILSGEDRYWELLSGL